VSAHAAELTSQRSLSGFAARVARLFAKHPIAAVVIVALLLRAFLAIGSAVVTDRYVIPDEGLYMAMGRTFVSGRPLESWYPGYGQSFYESLRGFNIPLVFLFEIFGPHPVVGRLFSAVVGAAAAGVTVALALRFLRPAFAVAAGLVVALTPTQILFSSAVLREAHVWLALTVVGLGVVLMMATDLRRFTIGLALAAAGLLYVGQMRDQTLLAASWAVALALILSPRALWAPRVAAGVALAVFMPFAGGIGYAGLPLVRGEVPKLAETRATLGADANTAFEPAEPAAPPRQPAAPPAAPAAPAAGAAPATTPAAPAGEPAAPAAEPDKTIVSGFRHLPEGVLNVTMRPFPWESSSSLSLKLARVENLEWYLLYVLFAIGVVVSVRHRAARLALQFPVALLALMTGIAAVTQGNLGTAFRHRDQILWVLALGAAAGAQWLWLRRRERRPSTAAVEAHAEPSPPERVATRA
jgi:hypothetical protein